jgi:hypothetical protein
MGTVFKAYDTQDPRGAEHPVALKILTATAESAFERFEREAATLRGVRHPNVVGYIDHASLPNGSAWMAMEWVEGETLRELLDRRRLTLDEVLALARGVAAGLAAAHSRGVVHRDIKPANLLLPGGDLAQVNIADFGVARLSTMARLTKTGAAVGTPAYMAPEQARGSVDVDARADMFSTGAVLYECLSGRVPFPGKRVVTMLARLVVGHAEPLQALCPDAPGALADLVMLLLSKEPVDRLADGGELVSALEHVVSGAEPDLGAARASASPQLVSLVLIPATEDGDGSPGIEHIGREHRARIESLAGTGSLLVFEQGPAVELARRAAIAAEQACSWLPEARVSVATGTLDGSWPGDVLGAATTAMLGDTGPGVSMDPLTDALRAGVDGAPASFIGRKRELGQLRGVWAEVIEERCGRGVLLVGAAGVGKTRLILELAAQLGETERCITADAQAPADVQAALAAGAPTLVVLGDVRDRDRDWLDVVLEAIDAHAPIMVIGGAPPQDVTDLIPDEIAERFQRIELGPLGQRASERLARSVASEELPESALEDIVELAAGNPLVIQALVRGQSRG